MLTLKSGDLTVELLDPNRDHDHFGARYCTAGYIFQILHAKHGPLLSGPTYPDEFNWFDGQGAPETFHRAPLHSNGEPDRVLIPGVGICSADQQKVLEYASWTEKRDNTTIRWNTDQQIGETSLSLTRSISIFGRTIRSVTRISNTGKGMVPVSWYPHPFFPHPGSDELCRFSMPVNMPGTDMFSLGADQAIYRVGWPWDGGGIAMIDHDARDHFSVTQRHPLLGSVTIVFGYVPAFAMIYGNANCFSMEPYFERTVGAGQSAEWFVDYVL